MKIVKKVSLFVGAVALATGMTVCQAEEMKVAVVNVQQVLQQSPRVAAMSKKLEGQFKDRQTSINSQQKSLQDELDTFKKEAPTMSDAQRKSTEKKLTDERAGLIKQVVAYQQDLQKEQGKVMQNILGDLNSVVSGIAKSSAYTLVLDSQAVVYPGNSTDITKQVATQFNAKS